MYVIIIVKLASLHLINDMIKEPCELHGGLAMIRGTSILGGEVRNVEISRTTQQLLHGKSHDFLAVFALAHSKINQIA